MNNKINALYFVIIVCAILLTPAGSLHKNNLFAYEAINNTEHINPETLKKELIELEKEVMGFSIIFEKVAQLIGPSVVKINIFSEDVSNMTGKNFNPMLPPPPPDRFFKPFDKKSFHMPMADDHARMDIGSGVIIDKKGYIVTNYHVVHDFNGGKIEVTLFDGKKFDGKIVGVDSKTDLAVIKIEGDDFQAAEFGDVKKIHVGDWVIAVGSPFNYQQTVSAGIVSSIGRKGVNPQASPFAYEDFIQTDASINPGSSGGPLVNMRGQIIGINAAIATRTGGFQGIGFAISETIVQQVTAALMENGAVRRGFIGVGMLNIDEKLVATLGLDTVNDVLNYLKLDSTNGVFVARIWDNTPASRTDIQPGDIILEMDNKIITNSESIQRVIRNLDVGSPVETIIVRHGKRVTVVIEIDEQPENMEGYGYTSVQNGILDVGFGLAVQKLNPDRTNIPINKDEKGILVADVVEGSIAHKAGLKVGDVINKIDSIEVSSLSKFCDIFLKLKNRNKPINLQLKSKGSVTLN